MSLSEKAEEAKQALADKPAVALVEKDLLRGAIIHLLYALLAFYQLWIVLVVIASLYVLMSIALGQVAKRT